MDYRQRENPEDTMKSPALTNDLMGNFSLCQDFRDFDPPNMSFGVGADQIFSEFDTPTDPSPLEPYLSGCGIEMDKGLDPSNPVNCCKNNFVQLNWDPRAMLTDLSLLEQEIHNVQEVVRNLIGQEGQLLVHPDELAARQQLVSADLMSIIVHLISTAGSLLPSTKSTPLSANPSLKQLEGIIKSAINSQGIDMSIEKTALPTDDQNKVPKNSSGEVSEHTSHDDHDAKDCEDGECENLPPGSYEVLQLEKEEILAPHTHFCQICGKGFKRDANLRMHMRGHGDEYKTPAALAKSGKELNSEHVLIRRYSCPVIGCKRNKEHKKFQPLKTILCVKNHYKRSHCDKSYTCSRCNNKKFSVIADLKTHEKHCGRDKWLCSCGTTFSRKDKLFGHVALFQGHTPALPLDENKSLCTSDQMQTCGGNAGFDFGGSCSTEVDLIDIKGVDEDPTLLSAMNFDPCNFDGFRGFPRPTFEVSDSSFPFMPAIVNACCRKNGEH